MEQYDIESYGISITTLEEVFLKINEEFREKEKEKEDVAIEDDEMGVDLAESHRLE